MKKLLILLPVLLAAACEGDVLPEAQPRLVVEGWIDAGGTPKVLLTTTVPLNEASQPVDSLGQYVVKWAKVTVSDGENTVVLMGKADNDYFPPYVYTTARLHGETGRSYRLTVDYKDFHAEAETTIPPVATPEGFKVERTLDSDTLYALTALLRDDPAQANYYKVFTRTGSRQNMWLSSMLGIFDDEALPRPVAEVPVYKADLDGTRDFTPYFSLDDTVMVKLAALDRESYLVWRDYEDISTFGGNMFLPLNRNMRTNVSGGLGYWCGYGASVTRLLIRKLWEAGSGTGEEAAAPKRASQGCRQGDADAAHQEQAVPKRRKVQAVPLSGQRAPSAGREATENAIFIKKQAKKNAKFARDKIID